MYLLSVIPISKGISHETLSYFSQKSHTLGSLISIPLRNKKIKGVVVKQEEVSAKKSEIKKLHFTVRSIGDSPEHAFLDPRFIEATTAIADYYATTTGSVLYTLIPQTIIDSPVEYDIPPVDQSYTSAHTLVLQADDDERYATYKSYIREEFSKKKSVFFCLPTIEDIEHARTILEKGIEQHTYTIHSGLSKKEIQKLWKEALNNPHPILIIGTGYFFSLPRRDIGTIIIDRENARGYVSQSRPYLDIRTVARIISKTYGIKLVLGDIVVRIETLYNVKTDVYGELSPLKFRSLSNASSVLIDMSATEEQPDVKRKFEPLSPEAIRLIQRGKEHNEHVFVYCSRKGLAPITVCGDCGQTVVCKECGAPVTLYGVKHKEQSEKTVFACHKCGARRSAMELCTRCASWRLSTLGIGTETIEKQLKEVFPKTDILLIDREHIKTHKQATALLKDFFAKPGSILVGTEMVLPYITSQVHHSIIASMDALFSIPDFHMTEKVMRTISYIRNHTEQTVLLQTRLPNQQVFEYALRGNTSDFYRDEIRERKIYNYPPFSTFIKITLSGEKETVRGKMKKLVEFFKPHEVNVFEAFHKGIYKHYTVHALLIVPTEEWVNKDIVEKIRSLPPEYMIKIDPDSLL